MGISFSGILDGRELNDGGEWEDDFTSDCHNNGIHKIVEIGKRGMLKETGDELDPEEVFNQIEIYGEKLKGEESEGMAIELEDQGAEY